MTRKSDDTKWHLDKKFPIALIATISIQTATIVWWASGITERVNVLERSATASAPQADRLTRVEVKLDAVQDGISEIKRSIQARR